jgi:hypothetical protein
MAESSYRDWRILRFIVGRARCLSLAVGLAYSWCCCPRRSATPASSWPGI